MNPVNARSALLVALCICTGASSPPAPAQDVERTMEGACLWVALPYQSDEASHVRALNAALEFAQRNKGTALRISLVADDPRELAEDRLFALGRAIQAVAQEVEVSLFDLDLMDKLAAWGVKRLPAFALVRNGRAHVCHSAETLKELATCDK